MTYQTLIERLRLAKIDSPEWDARLLIEHFCQTDTMPYLIDPHLEFVAPAELEAAIVKRESRYPLQYILGEWQFYRQTYEVSPDCLIPRSDTEILVEEAIRTLPASACFADFCTGSGCIAISVLAERPDLEAIAVDKFENTLSLAMRNAEKNGVRRRVAPICADLLTCDFSSLAPLRSLDAILCNPPYIPTAELSALEPELDAEPRAALDGGEDGLIFYRTLLANAAPLLTKDGFFLFEIGYDQAEALRLLGVQYGFDGYRLLRDYGGNDRVVRLWRTNGIH